MPDPPTVANAILAPSKLYYSNIKIKGISSSKADLSLTHNSEQKPGDGSTLLHIVIDATT